MTMFRQIKRNRRIVAGTAVLVMVLAVAIGVFADDGPGVLQATATVAALALPAVFALISLDRRPSLLPGAVMAAIIAGVLVLGLLPLWLVVAIVWGMVARTRPRPAPEPRWAWFGRPLLAAAVAVPILLMFSHLDPVCTVTYTDGRVQQVDAATHGYPTGWRFSFDTYTTGSESVSGVTAQACSSNTVVWWEATFSLIATAGIVLLACRWPTGNQLLGPTSPGEPALTDR